MTNIELQNLSLNVEEAKSVSEAIFEQVLMHDAYLKYHNIHTGIQWDTQIPFIGSLGLVGRISADCKPDANTSKIPISEKRWSPKLIGDRLEHCAKDLDGMLKLFGKQKNASEFYNRIDSEDMGVIVMRVTEALTAMLQRLAWFGDTAAKEQTAGGVFKDASVLPYFTPIDGIWKQVFAEIPTGADNYVAIGLNTAADTAGQRNMPDDFAYKLFTEMTNRLDSRALQAKADGAKFQLHVTRDIAQNWKNFKMGKSLVFTISNAENGGLKDMFDDIEIVPRYDWDNIITTYQSDGTKKNLPNRALLTTSANIPIGTLSEKDLKTLKSFYDEYHKVNCVDFDVMLDAKFLEPSMAVAAY